MRGNEKKVDYLQKYRLSRTGKKKVRRSILLLLIFSIFITLPYTSVFLQTYASDQTEITNEMQTPETSNSSVQEESVTSAEDSSATENSETSNTESSSENSNESSETTPESNAESSEEESSNIEDSSQEELEDSSDSFLETDEDEDEELEEIELFALSPLGYDLSFLHNATPGVPTTPSPSFMPENLNWSHVNTFGILYDDWALVDPEEVAWIVDHYDMVLSGTVRKEASYDLLKAANPNVKLIGYSVASPEACEYMEQWCADRGIDPELLYYHYAVDTVVKLRQIDPATSQPKTITVPGYPYGSATSVEESRVLETWRAGNPAICPTSPVLREAYIAYVIEKHLAVNPAQGKYLDGIFWDTFDANIDTYYDLQLQNTHEMQFLGCGDADSARAQSAQDLLLLRSEMERTMYAVAGKPVRVIPNAAEDEYIQNGYSVLYKDAFGGDYDEVMIEYLTNSLRCRMVDAKYYMDVYNDLENGVLYIINSETNVFSKDNLGRPITDQQWEDFRQFSIAAQYLVLHPNAYFSYHQGSAAIYQGVPKGTVSVSHWNVNYEFDIGNPVVRSGVDAWGSTGTNRFYVFAEKSLEYKVLAREFDNCLIIAKFGGDTGTVSPMGGQQETYQLDGEYRRLMPDNSYGPVITEITLGKGGGAILVKRSYADAQDGGYVPSESAPAAPSDVLPIAQTEVEEETVYNENPKENKLEYIPRPFPFLVIIYITEPNNCLMVIVWILLIIIFLILIYLWITRKRRRVRQHSD